jgi:hypothetical protein
MESSLSFSKLWQDVKTHRRLYYIVLPVTFVVAAVISLSIPNYYNCTVKLAPEIPGNSSGGSLASLASSFGVNLGSSNAAGGDAIMPNLYPDLMNSAVFMSSLFAIPVTFEEDDSMKTVTYYEYLQDHQRAPWWSTARKALFKSIASLFTSKEEEEDTTVDPFHLTKEQAAIVEALEKKVVSDVDKKTYVITINVTDDGHGNLTATTNQNELPLFENMTKPGTLTITKETNIATDETFTFEVVLENEYGQPLDEITVLKEE